jgi:hypothetical protein
MNSEAVTTPNTPHHAIRAQPCCICPCKRMC